MNLEFANYSPILWGAIELMFNCVYIVDDDNDIEEDEVSSGLEKEASGSENEDESGQGSEEEEDDEVNEEEEASEEDEAILEFREKIKSQQTEKTKTEKFE